MRKLSQRGDLPRILVVDNEAHCIRLLEVILQPEGFEVDSASSGEAALISVAQRQPDLILLDIMMPGMDGYELSRRLKADAGSRNIPIIMLSVLVDREARMLGLSAGADDFLTKPVDRAELCARVRNLLKLKAYGDYHRNYSQLLEVEVLARTAELEERSAMLEQKATEMRLSEERTNFAMGAARMGIWEVELRTGKLTWSASMAPLFGLAQDQVPKSASEFFELIHPDDRLAVREHPELEPGTGELHEVEFRILWPDGSVHWNTGRARILRGADGSALRLLGIACDISERKLLEAQLRQAQKMEAIGQLAGGVAHDFNNLLTAILGYSNFVLDTLPADDPRRDDMEQVITAGQRAATLTGQLLAFSRKQVLQPTTLNVDDVVAGMRPMLSRLIGEHIALVPILAGDVGSVRADRGQLEQVLMNLVVNARDAMPTGGRIAIETANVELDQSCSATAVVRPGAYVMLSVSDTGTGMTDETKQRLFEPFFTTKDQGKGTGLGLATVYGIVQQSGGHVWVYSELGRGATFKVYLPRTDGLEAGSIAKVPEQSLPSPTETLLLVEDDLSVRLLTKTILERVGYRVYDAPDSARAEQVFEEHGQAITLLVTDVIMPGANGPALYEQLRQRKPDLRVLYVSGYTDDAIVRQGQLDPGVDFLQKPFTAAALHRRVRAVLGRSVGVEPVTESLSPLLTSV